MKSAKDIATITKIACEDLVTKWREDTMEFINGVMCDNIEKCAKKGVCSTKFHVTENVDRDLVRQVFEAEGFEVSIKGYDVSISWLHVFVKL